MRIGSYDEPVYLLKITDDPFAFTQIRHMHAKGRALLRSMVGKSFELSHSGYPVTAQIIKNEEERAEIKGYVDAIYALNEAVPVALNIKNRRGLRNEIPKIAMPDMKKYLKPKDENLGKPSEKKAPKNDEPLEIGINMDTSPQASAFRAGLAQKRRDLNEFYLTQSFLYPLAMMGIMSDPLYATAILSSEGFGLKDNLHSCGYSWEVRLETIRILESIVESYWHEFEEHRKAGSLPIRKEDFSPEVSLVTFFDLIEMVRDLEAIQHALEQKKSGVNDNNPDVRECAEETANKSFKAQSLITRYLESQGYSITNQAV